MPLELQHEKHQCCADVDRNGIPGLSDEQWAKLLDMLSVIKTSGVERLSVNTNVSLNDWIVDSGASHHMSGDVSLLSSRYRTMSCGTA